MTSALGLGHGAPMLKQSGLAAALSLLFMGGTLDPRLTFSRASNATQFNASGELVFAPHQLTFRGNITQPQWSASMATDGTVSPGGVDNPTGQTSGFAIWTTPAPGAGCTISTQPVVPGIDHVFSIYLRYINWRWARVILYSNANTTNQVRLWVDLVNKTAGTAQAGGTATLNSEKTGVVDVGNGWVRVTVAGNASWASAADAGLLFASAAADASAVRVGNGAAIEAAGPLFEVETSDSPQQWCPEFYTSGASYYGPRNCYDPSTLQPLGALLEEQRTNLVPWSTNFGNTTGWTATACSLSAGSTLLGHQSVRLTADGVPGQHYAFPGSLAVAPSASTIYTQSAFIKSFGAQFIQMRGGGNWSINGSSCYVNFDIVNGVVGTIGASVVAAGITPCGGGVFRAWIAHSSSAAPAAGAPTVFTIVSGLTASNNENNSLAGGFEVMGCQMEVGAFPTSMIPTIGAAATRSADNLDLPGGIASIYTPLGMTMFCEVMKPHFPPSGVGHGVATFGDSGNAINITYGTSSPTQFRCDVTNGGVASAQTNVNLHAAGTVYKFATRIAPNDHISAQNGVLGAADAAGDLPAAISAVAYIGRGGASSNYMNGYLRRLSFYSAPLNNTQLQALTT